MSELTKSNQNSQLDPASLNPEELALMLKGLDTENGTFEVTSEYVEFDEGIENLFVFIGMTKITNTFQKDNDDENSKFVPAVKLIDEEGRTRITASAVLVGACSELIAPTPIKVVATGRTKGKNGTYQNLRVFVLTREKQLKKENNVAGPLQEKKKKVNNFN